MCKKATDGKVIKNHLLLVYILKSLPILQMFVSVCQCWAFSGSFSVSFFFLKVADEAVCGPQLTEHRCNWVSCQRKFGKQLWEICFVKKQKESLNSFCLSLVLLANRYPTTRFVSSVGRFGNWSILPNIKDCLTPNLWQSSCCYYILQNFLYFLCWHWFLFSCHVRFCISLKEFPEDFWLSQSCFSFLSVLVSFLFSRVKKKNLFWVCWVFLMIKAMFKKM